MQKQKQTKLNKNKSGNLLESTKTCQFDKCPVKDKSLYDETTGKYYTRFHPECAKVRRNIEVESARFDYNDTTKGHSQYYALKEEIAFLKVQNELLEHRISTLEEIINRD